MTTETIDIRVHDEGTIVLFTPLTPAATSWLRESVQPDAQWLGRALVCEHRFAQDLAFGASAAGLVVKVGA